MHILVHDFAGHPFQVELSRELARRGHRVVHAYFAADTGPKGQMSRVDGDPEESSFLAHGETIAYSKTDFRKRRAGDITYGRTLADYIRAYYQFLERRQMRRAAKVVHITDAFRTQTDQWGIPADRVGVIPNWGAIAEIDVLDLETQ